MLMYHSLGTGCLLQLSEPAGMIALHLFQCNIDHAQYKEPSAKHSGNFPTDCCGSSNLQRRELDQGVTLSCYSQFQDHHFSRVLMILSCLVITANHVDLNFLTFPNPLGSIL